MTCTPEEWEELKRKADKLAGKKPIHYKIGELLWIMKKTEEEK